MTLTAADQFHVGIVVEDFEATLEELSEAFGYEWCEEMIAPTQVVYPHGAAEIISRFVYSMNTPRLEIIRPIPDSLWVPAAGSGVHHLGYWSDDVAADSEALAQRGFAVEVAGGRDGVTTWTYQRRGSGPRIELVTRALEPILEQYWATGKRPQAPPAQGDASAAPSIPGA